MVAEGASSLAAVAVVGTVQWRHAVHFLVEVVGKVVRQSGATEWL
jgi:hypothetical protein